MRKTEKYLEELSDIKAQFICLKQDIEYLRKYPKKVMSKRKGFVSFKEYMAGLLSHVSDIEKFMKKYY